MKLGHRGANHPVKNLLLGNVEITSQNHGFEVVKRNLPKSVEITHQSLFDNSIEGIKLKNKPVFLFSIIQNLILTHKIVSIYLNNLL